MQAYHISIRVLVALFVFAFVNGCQSSGSLSTLPTISTPPTTVVAWTGPGGSIETIETKNGEQYTNRQLHTTGSDISYGPAIAHDRKASFMLMWIKGPELQYRMGCGGLTSPTAGGVTWDQDIETNKLNVFVLGGAPTGSPALAYGNGHWVVVFARNNQLFVSRISNNLAAAWESPTQVMHQDVSGSNRPAVVQGSPSIAFVRSVHGDPNYRTLGRFVLMYRHTNLGVVSSISDDGLSWSTPTVVSPGISWEKSPALTEATGSDNWGRFYAVLTRSVSATGTASGIRKFLFESEDGSSWQAVGDTTGYSPSALLPASPIIVYGGTEVGGCGQPRTLSLSGRIGQCYLLMIEAGAMPGSQTSISHQRLQTFDLCYAPYIRDTDSFSPHVSLDAYAHVGSPNARPAATNGWKQEEFCP